MEDENKNPNTTENMEDFQAQESSPETPRAEDLEQKEIVAKEPNKKRRNVLIIIAVTLIAIAGVGSAYLLLQDNSDDEITLTPVDTSQVVTTLGASVATIEGTAQTSRDGENWKDAEGGESLANLDYIRTLEDSRAIVLFDDGSVVRLNSDTTIYLSSLQKESTEITLQEGRVYSRVAESESRTYTVVTANERFMALGTAFTTSSSVEKDELEVYQSDVEVESQKVKVSEGNKYDSETKELSALDLKALEEDDFAQWNKQKDSEIDDFKDKLGVLADKVEEEAEEPESSTTPEQSAGIQLSGVTSDKGVTLKWTVSGLAMKQGFKVVRDKSDSTPSYGQHQALYVGESTARSTVWYDDNGGTYYYRVCIYSEGTCTNYSNAVRVESPLVKKAAVESGTIQLTISGNKLNWKLVGGNAPHGYKILLSDKQNPTYPEHSISYVGSDTSSSTLPEKAAGTYFVRVCKYTNGTQEAGCVDYSNQVEYVLE